MSFPEVDRRRGDVSQDSPHDWQRGERDATITRGEVNEVRETPGWEMISVQIDSGAIDTVGPKEIAKAFEMKETAMSKRGNG